METLALAFELELNRGYTAIRASASGNALTIYSRSLGTDGNFISIAASANTTNLTIELSGATLTGGCRWNLAYGLRGGTAIESRGSRLEPELLSSS